MATLAPCSAKRTAIAWPMPELPPVTSTFLPRRPGMASVRASAGDTDMGPPRVDVGVVAAQQQEAAEREQEHGEQPGADERGGARRVDQAELEADGRGRDDE